MAEFMTVLLIGFIAAIVCALGFTISAFVSGYVRAKRGAE